MKAKHLPYHPYRGGLYSWKELMDGFSPEKDDSLDFQIYNHFFKTKFHPPLQEALCQRIHDHSIDDSLRKFLAIDEHGMTNKPCVGFMGGHSTKRSDPFYLKTVETAKLITEAGFFVVSGGGPGIMEAANLGAYLAGQDEEMVDKAIKIISKAPYYEDPGYHEAAFELLDLIPDGAQSLAIPTWFYGHEPSNLFASHIAKYFSNSIREDTLLAVCLHGVVFAPGSAGTTQEIFQDATQNHYGTMNYYSPMIFLGKKRYQEDTMIFDLVKQLSEGQKYADRIFLTDEPDDVLSFLKAHPPLKV